MTATHSTCRLGARVTSPRAAASHSRPATRVREISASSLQPAAKSLSALQQACFPVFAVLLHSAGPQSFAGHAHSTALSLSSVSAGHTASLSPTRPSSDPVLPSSRPLFHLSAFPFMSSSSTTHRTGSSSVGRCLCVWCFLLLLPLLCRLPSATAQDASLSSTADAVADASSTQMELASTAEQTELTCQVKRGEGGRQRQMAVRVARRRTRTRRSS